MNKTVFLILILFSISQEVNSQSFYIADNYNLSIEIDYDNEKLFGSAEIVLKNITSKTSDEISLLLYRLLKVRSITDNYGKPLKFQQNTTSFSDFSKLQVNHVVILPEKPIQPGQSVTITVKYSGHLLGYNETGMLYIKDSIKPKFTIIREDAFAYPRPGFPSYKINRKYPLPNFTYNAKITVPKGLIVANGGLLEDTEENNDSKTFTYSSILPSWRMDFAIAPYEQLTTDNIKVFYLPESLEGAKKIIKASNTAISIYTKWFGPTSNSNKLTFIEIPDGWGSQTDVTTIIQTSAAFRDTTRHREVYHEIFHLWNVSPTERPSPRWDEGLASFLEYLVSEKITGKPITDSRANQLLEWLNLNLKENPEWARIPLVDYGKFQMTDLSYSVGALFFDLLHRILGQDNFNNIIKNYLNKYRSGGTTSNFTDEIINNGNESSKKLVTDWIFTTQWAELVEENSTIEEMTHEYK